MVLISCLLVSLCSWTAGLSVSSPAEDHNPENQQHQRDTLSSKGPFKQRWREESDSSGYENSLGNLESNEITSNHVQNERPSSQQPSSQPDASQLSQSYACGRAIATRKFTNNYSHKASINTNELSPIREQHLFQQFQSSQSGMRTLNKYRPFEIRMPRIIGGDETLPGEFPWTVSIKLNGQPICGGSLIDRSWILTAAHCVVGYNPKNLTIRLGAYRIKDMNEQQTIDTTISKFIVHKQYSMPRPFSNDIALLKMVEPINFSEFIIPICLPTEDQVSTSSSSELDNDYARPVAVLNSSPQAESLSALGDQFDEHDTGGLVVSTKMSDKEISRCFKRLEQNYLSSIGLGNGSGSGGSVGSPAPPPSAPAAPGPPLNAQGLPASADSADTPPLVSFNSGPNRLTSQAPTAANQRHQLRQLQQQLSKQPALKVTFLEPAPPTASAAEQHFELDASGPSSDSHRHDNGPPTIKQHHQDSGYYNLPWGRLAGGSSAPLEGRAASDQADELGLSSKQSRGPEHKIKLTSLPISKELLREIQSVGSMQSLALGLQQNDIVAMAESGENRLQAEQGEPVVANAAATVAFAGPTGQANRERVIGSTVGSSLRQFVRTNVLEDTQEADQANLVDDPSKYSGISGIVVGWGWVRENDNEEQHQVSRSQQSVTLQKVRLPILRNKDCEAWFRSQEKKITLLPSQFCAGFNTGGKDACRVSPSFSCRTSWVSVLHRF